MSNNIEAWWTSKVSQMAASMKDGGVKRLTIWATPKGSYKFEVVPVTVHRPRVECPECGKSVSTTLKGVMHSHRLKDGKWCEMPNKLFHRDSVAEVEPEQALSCEVREENGKVNRT